MGREYNYILAFPTAGGHMNKDHLDGVLFDHLMLEGRKSTHPQLCWFDGFADFSRFEVGGSHDMVEWIWIHMAINAVSPRQLHAREI